MGIETVRLAETREQVQETLKHLLKDIRALERMLSEDLFETDIVRIGAEQELCLVDKYAKPLPIAMELLGKMDRENVTTELAKFNLEVNLDPLEFTGDCLSRLEDNILIELDLIRESIREFEGDIVLTGILPTIRKSDLDTVNLTPLSRYKALCDAINKLRGDEYDLRIQGMDELLMRFDSPLLEACNTSFQVHMQVTPENFAEKYNAAQAITGPVLAAAVNSPLLFGKRLWSETRVALFHQSVDTRKAGDHLRENDPRVTFGNEWVKESILEIYKEDIARYRIMLGSNITEDVEEMLDRGDIPKLLALQVHNGTVYRWNRPCYGISDGKPHLRIENRVFSGGPTVADEIANTAFWLGLMNSMGDHYRNLTDILDFDDAKMNFIAASKLGLDTKFRWVGDKSYAAIDRIKEEFLPMAREGLKSANIDQGDVDSYLDIIHDRVESAQTGSYWMVQSYNTLVKDISREQALTAITNSMIKNQRKGEPVHRWAVARQDDMEMWQPSSLLVEEFMTTDLFTVQKDDIIELVANLVEWRRVRYVPVEDDSKHLIGLISMRMLFREFNDIVHNKGSSSKAVEEIMIKNPTTIHPEASILEAVELMASQKIGCLPVVKNNRLVGMITEANYMAITARLLKQLHSAQASEK